jgi:RNA polymerase sigma-70 factor (ECF subfamily)
MTGPLNRLARPSSDDDQRVSALYKETSEALFAFLLRRCLTPSDAADCMAETYRIAWEKRDRMPVGDEARPWLFGIARNVARQERTRDRRREALSRELALVAESSQMVTSAEDSRTAAALCELSPLDREIVTMLTWDGLAPREVASILGLSPNAVRVRSYKARTRLRTLLVEGDTNRAAETLEAPPATSRRG